MNTKNIFLISVAVFALLSVSSTKAATFDFDLLLTPPSSASIVQGNSISITVGAVSRGNITTQTSFSVSHLPPGATASINSPGPNVADITIVTSAATPAGSIPIAIIASWGGVIKTTVFTLTITAPKTFQGDNTYTVKDGDVIKLNNGFETLVHIKKNRDYSDIEVSLSSPNTMGYIFILPGMEKSLYDNTQKWIKNGAIVRLKSQDKEKEEAMISFQSTKILGSWFRGLIVLLVVALIAFLLEFIIKFKSQNFLYRYTFIRSFVLGIILSFMVAGLTGGEWAFVVFIEIAPIIIIETILFSYVAYKILAKRVQSS